MLLTTVQMIRQAYTQKQSEFDKQTKAGLLESFNKLKESVIKIQEEQKTFYDQFSVIAENLIESNSFFKSSDLKDIFLKEEGTFNKDKVFSIDPDYKKLQNEVRTLFFTELFLNCHIFFYKTRQTILKAVDLGKPLNCAIMNNLFETIHGINKKEGETEWLTKIGEELRFLWDLRYSLLRFRNFVNTLETAFCNITGVSRDLLRKCLYK
ncbi:hypothetical protein CDIK_4288, partial [Cucumispora dikerogammari]